MASTRSQSTRSTRSSKSLANNVAEQMEVDEAVSGLQQLSRGNAKDNSNNCNNGGSSNHINHVDGGGNKSSSGSESAEKTETASSCGGDSSFPNNLLEAANAANSNGPTPKAMETEQAQESDSGSSSSESTDSSDSEDSSDTDEEVAARNKQLDQEDVQMLEKMFLYVREQMYDERTKSVSSKLEEVRMGRAKEYLGPLEQLQETMSVKTEIASKRRDYRLENLANKTDAEKLAAQQNFENEKEILYDKIKDDLEERIRRLEEDRHNDFSSDFFYDAEQRKKNKKTIDLFGEKKKKAVQMNGPYIVYMLSDFDIMEDWTAVKKILSQASKRKCVEPLY